MRIVQLIMLESKESSDVDLYDKVYEKFETDGCLDMIENLQMCENQFIAKLAEEIVR